ncbi:hypothetical protein GW17_00028892 [Ensete ventricosum]|nr:hypothetical protein GW17_00028892 [Ensete ventricosum]
MYWSLQQPAGSSEQAESTAETSEVSADDATSQNGEDRSSMGDEGHAEVPAAESPATKKRARDGGDLKRVAEIVMVLSAMGQMRGGRQPTAAEKALVAEARERLVAMCEGVKPKELFSGEAVRVVVEDLGLNRSKDPVMGFRPPKISIADKLLLTKKKVRPRVL